MEACLAGNAAGKTTPPRGRVKTYRTGFFTCPKMSGIASEHRSGFKPSQQQTQSQGVPSSLGTTRLQPAMGFPSLRTYTRHHSPK